MHFRRPVCARFKRRLGREVRRFGGKRVSDIACEMSLKQTGNVYEDAKSFLEANADEVERKVTQLLEAQLSSAQSLVFKLGAVQVNMQSGEVLVNNRSTQHTPVHVAAHPSFTHLFGTKTLCSVSTRHEHRLRLQLQSGGVAYSVEAWRPLLGKTKQQLYVARPAQGKCASHSVRCALLMPYPFHLMPFHDIAAVGALKSSLWATAGGKGATNPPQTTSVACRPRRRSA